MDLLPIARHLHAARIGLFMDGRDKNLFIYSMPELVSAVLLRDDPSGTAIDHELVGMYRTEFQVVVRRDDHVKGSEMALAISEALTISESVVGASIYAWYIRPLHLPIVFPVSDGGLLEFSVNFDACYRSISS